ncbi:hypothetical protein NQZ79_g7135 [Umbelopsis isabellina]|nr:hypothetical protein NQZ79_g7135 [Umbelopsis isabellina]
MISPQKDHSQQESRSNREDHAEIQLEDFKRYDTYSYKGQITWFWAIWNFASIELLKKLVICIFRSIKYTVLLRYRLHSSSKMRAKTFLDKVKVDKKCCKITCLCCRDTDQFSIWIDKGCLDNCRELANQILYLNQPYGRKFLDYETQVELVLCALLPSGALRTQTGMGFVGDDVAQAATRVKTKLLYNMVKLDLMISTHSPYEMTTNRLMSRRKAIFSCVRCFPPMSCEDLLEDDISIPTPLEETMTTANLIKAQMLAYEMGFEQATYLIGILATVHKHRVLWCKTEATGKYKVRYSTFNEKFEPMHAFEEYYLHRRSCLLSRASFADRQREIKSILDFFGNVTNTRASVTEVDSYYFDVMFWGDEDGCYIEFSNHTMIAYNMSRLGVINGYKIRSTIPGLLVFIALIITAIMLPLPFFIVNDWQLGNSGISYTDVLQTESIMLLALYGYLTQGYLEGIDQKSFWSGKSKGTTVDSNDLRRAGWNVPMLLRAWLSLAENGTVLFRFGNKAESFNNLISRYKLTVQSNVVVDIEISVQDLLATGTKIYQELNNEKFPKHKKLTIIDSNGRHHSAITTLIYELRITKKKPNIRSSIQKVGAVRQ